MSVDLLPINSYPIAPYIQCSCSLPCYFWTYSEPTEIIQLSRQTIKPVNMTYKHQNIQYGGQTFNLLSNDLSQYIDRYCTANVLPNSLSSVHATSVGSSAIATENAISQTYTRSTTMPEGDDHTTEIRLGGGSMAQGVPYFASGQARACTITNPVNSCSIARYSSNYMSQPLQCSCSMFPPGSWTWKKQENINTLFYPHAASVSYTTYSLEFGPNIEKGQKLTSRYT